MSPTTWSAEQDATLRTMAAWPLPGATAVEIANAVGKSKQAVIARIHREVIPWTRRQQQFGGVAERLAAKVKIMRKPTPAKPKVTPMSSPHPPAEPIAPPPPTSSPRAELIAHLRAQSGQPVGATTLFCLEQDACRWPLWGNHEPTPAEPLFCGRKTAGRPYCPEHCSLAYQPAHGRARPHYVRAA